MTVGLNWKTWVRWSHPSTLTCTLMTTWANMNTRTNAASAVPNQCRCLKYPHRAALWLYKLLIFSQQSSTYIRKACLKVQKLNLHGIMTRASCWTQKFISDNRFQDLACQDLCSKQNCSFENTMVYVHMSIAACTTPENERLSLHRQLAAPKRLSVVFMCALCWHKAMDAAACLLSTVPLSILQNNDNWLLVCEIVLVQNSRDDHVCLPWSRGFQALHKVDEMERMKSFCFRRPEPNVGFRFRIRSVCFLYVAEASWADKKYFAYHFLPSFLSSKRAASSLSKNVTSPPHEQVSSLPSKPERNPFLPSNLCACHSQFNTGFMFCWTFVRRVFYAYVFALRWSGLQKRLPSSLLFLY
jgi:hypothetical protein